MKTRIKIDFKIDADRYQNFLTGEWNAEEGVAARAATAAAAVEELLLLLFKLPAGAARTEPPLLLSTRRGGLFGDNGLVMGGCF